MRAPGWLTTTVSRYRRLDLEYAALRVVGRGLFLAVMLMVAFLFVFARVTDLIAGDNEVLIPTASVSANIDLGALAQGAFSRTSASVVSVIGLVTLIVSAIFTGHALRQGSRRALLGEGASTVRLLSGRTIAVSVALGLVVLLTWLLTLTTSIRRRAWATLIGRDIDAAVVDTGKALAVLLSLSIIATAVLRRTPRPGASATARLHRGRCRRAHRGRRQLLPALHLCGSPHQSGGVGRDRAHLHPAPVGQHLRADLPGSTLLGWRDQRLGALASSHGPARR